MDYEQAVVEFISDTANIKLALEVSEHMERVKNSLHLKFWKAVCGKIDNILNKTGYKLSKYKKGDLLGQWDGYEVTALEHPIVQKSQNCEIAYFVKQENNRVYFCIESSHEVVDWPKINEAEPLLKKLQELTLRASKWSPGWRWTDIRLREKDTLISIANDDSMSETAVLQLKNMIEHTYDEYMKVSQSLEAQGRRKTKTI